MEALDARAGDRVVDVGGGTGRFASLIHEDCGLEQARAGAASPDPAAREGGRGRVIRARDGSAMDVSLPDRSWQAPLPVAVWQWCLRIGQLRVQRPRFVRACRRTCCASTRRRTCWSRRRSARCECPGRRPPPLFARRSKCVLARRVASASPPPRSKDSCACCPRDGTARILETKKSIPAAQRGLRTATGTGQWCAESLGS